MHERSYTYFNFTLRRYSQCLHRFEAKIVFEDGNGCMLKCCPEHER